MVCGRLGRGQAADREEHRKQNINSRREHMAGNRSRAVDWARERDWRSTWGGCGAIYSSPVKKVGSHWINLVVLMGLVPIGQRNGAGAICGLN